MTITADTAAALRLVGVDPDRLVERRTHRGAAPVDVAVRRRELLDQAASEYVLADRHVVSADPFVDDQLERTHVRLQHDHPLFFGINQPIPAASMAGVLAITNATAALIAVIAWIAALPLAVWLASVRVDRRNRRRAQPPLELVQSTLGEQLRADQRRHVARWADQETK